MTATDDGQGPQDIGNDPSEAERLGVTLCNQGRFEQAVAVFQRVLDLNPEHAGAAANMGAALQCLGRWDDAVRILRRAVRMNPAFAQAHYNLGHALQHLDQWDQAVLSYRQAVECHPQYRQAWTNLAVVYRELGLLESAVAAARQAIKLDPSHAMSHFNLAYMLLQSGQFTEGWAEHEWRFQAHITHLRTYLQPVWRGEPMAGKTLLVWAEQGYGDTIQFVRFIPQLAARGIAVVLQVQSPLVSLLSGMTGAARVIGLDEDPPPFDRHIALMSLPHLLGVTLDLIPPDCPYLPRPAPLSVPSTPKRRIGVVWAGSPTHHNDRRRSIAVADMAKLTQWTAVDWISLAKDPPVLPANVQPPPLAFDDFRQTAQVIASLDLVITVDTAMAHLSAALGVPTWVLLGYAPDWRWLTGRGDSPWYPQVRLFRQTRPGDWAGVLADVIAALNERVGNPRLS